MDIVEATRTYEDWMRQNFQIIKEDLDLKHDNMAEDIFIFMRATFYRWIQLWADDTSFGKLRDGIPNVLAVGDLHVENFGTWRDSEGRLVWGINDFDEAFQLAYTADLVRLVASAFLALDAGYFTLPMETISAHVLDGYRSGLNQGGGAIVLAEESAWLRDLIEENLKDPVKFWEKLNLPESTAPPPAARQALERMIPPRGRQYRLSNKTGGQGSLGRERLVSLITLGGAHAAREAKQLFASASSLAWMNKKEADTKIYYNNILENAIRSPDPFLREIGGWIVRRLSPDYVRLELSSLDSEKLIGQVLNTMGWETANVHLGNVRDTIIKVRDNLKSLETDPGPDWLPTAADKMLEFLQEDFRYWKENRPG
jgi:hypothetical protein